MKKDQLVRRMPLPAPRSARVLAGAVAIVFLLPAPLYVLTGWDGGSGASAPLHVVVPLTAALALLHLRHARAALQEKRPQGWVWSLGGLLLCVYAPLPVWGFNWASAQTFVIATAMLLLRGPLRWILAALPLVVMGVYVVDEMAALDGHWVTIPLFWFYWWSGLVLGGASLWGSVRLVRVLDELMAARRRSRRLPWTASGSGSLATCMTCSGRACRPCRSRAIWRWLCCSATPPPHRTRCAA
jgi:two-component system sensor histidine kinase DesK